METFGLSQEDISLRVGKDRSTIANTLRLLKLPHDIQTSLIHREITPGHARALLALNSLQEQIKIHRLIVQKEMTVRKTENLVKGLTQPARNATPDTKNDPYLRDMERQLASRMLASVKISYGKKRGTIEIGFAGNEELNRLLHILMDSG